MLTHGTKGSDVYSTTGSKLLDLSVMLNRGLSNEVIRTYIRDIFTDGTLQDKIDTFVLAFQTRDIRGGKGERDLFYNMIVSLQKLSPQSVKAILPLIPEYGSWQDFLCFKTNNKLPDDIQQLIFKQLDKDEATPVGESISLLAKWLPREHSNIECDRKLAKDLSRCLYPNDPKAQEKYRKRITYLNKRLDTVEIRMCANKYSLIEPSKVPGRALKQYTKAFLNQPVKGLHGRKIIKQDLDRITCAQNFRDHFALASKGNAKVNGANTVYPHEIIHSILNEIYPDIDALVSQWHAIVKSVKDTGALSQTLAMCDFSGSMMGTPMDVSMALGLIIAECNTGIFADHLLTFDAKPKLHKFESTNIINRVNEIRNLGQGLSTDFQAAYNLILQKMKELRVSPGQEPKDLIVLTDMCWDEACIYKQHSKYSGNTYNEAVKTKIEETHIQIARRAFKLAGEQLFGEGMGWKPPRIVIWNLRSENENFHAQTLEEGVVQVSGWSPSLLRVIITHGADKLTPEAMFRSQLDDPRYDAVRTVVTPILTSVT